MKIRNMMIVGFSLLLMNGCTSMVVASLGKGEQFTFVDKEDNSKMVYHCLEEEKLENIKTRAQKAHDYFIKTNNENSDKIFEEMRTSTLPKKDKVNLMVEQMSHSAEVLQKDLKNKYSCMLIDTID